VPDAVLRQADEIELVDTSPQLLRHRMLNGNIYPPDRVQRALRGFFGTENLSTLRELTLRFLAGETEGDLLHELRRSPDPARQPAERVLVGVKAAPGTDAVVRGAARIAARVEADLHVVHVSPTDALRSADHAPLNPLRGLAEQLGAR